MALFNHGFRPFFLAAGVVAPLAVGLWVAVLAGLPVPDGPLPMLRWHAHELLAGFVAAAMIGFLMTAVPNWTGRRGYAGLPLIAVFALFIMARLVLLPGSPVPIGVAAPLALLPLPVTFLLILPALIRARTARLFGPPLLVLVFWAGQVMMLAEAAGWWTEAGWERGQMLMANAALLLVGLIGGRIVPAFTLNALRRVGRPMEPHPLPGVDSGALLALGGVVLVDLVMPNGTAAGIVAAAAAVLVGLRLSRWHGVAALGMPLVWVLHLGILLAAVALALKAAWLLGGFGWAAAWLHMQTAGAIATMILAVMTRATLGHTGRDLAASPATVVCYAMVVAAAFARVFSSVAGADARGVLVIAAALWIGAFVAFLGAYAPMLVRRRVDGKPG